MWNLYMIWIYWIQTELFSFLLIVMLRETQYLVSLKVTTPILYLKHLGLYLFIHPPVIRAFDFWMKWKMFFYLKRGLWTLMALKALTAVHKSPPNVSVGFASWSFQRCNYPHYICNVLSFLQSVFSLICMNTFCCLWHWPFVVYVSYGGSQRLPNGQITNMDLNSIHLF